MLMLSRVSMRPAPLLIWESMWLTKVFDVYAIFMCNWSRWVYFLVPFRFSGFFWLKIPFLFPFPFIVCIQGSNLPINGSFTKNENNNHSDWDGIAWMQFKSKVSHLLGVSAKSTTNYTHRFSQYSHQCSTFHSSWLQFRWFFCLFVYFSIFLVFFSLDNSKFGTQLSASTWATNNDRCYFRIL